MNLYFLVEGDTEKFFYPNLLELVNSGFFRQAKTISDVNNENNWVFAFKTGGFPSIHTNHLENAILEVVENGTFDYFFICYDIDSSTVSERSAITYSLIAEFEQSNNVSLNCSIKVIAQNVCIETWFLGNRDFCFPAIHLLNYNITESDPELLREGRTLHRINNPQQVHKQYFKKICAFKRMNYSESNPSIFCTPEFIQGIINRINQTDHLNSFRYFHQVISNL